MKIEKYSLKNDGEMNISDHFKVKEFRCKDGSDAIYIDVDFVEDKLEAIRSYFDCPVIITSAYRTVSYNKKCGGAKNSCHLRGRAFDITIHGKSPIEIAKVAEELEIKGIISYSMQGFCHVDSRNKKYWAINNRGKVSVQATFKDN